MRPGDTLVIWKLSRLERLPKRLIETIQGVQDKSIELNESIETRTPSGKLLFHIVADFALSERDKL